MLKKIRKSIIINRLSAFVSQKNLFRLRKLTHKAVTLVTAIDALDLHGAYYGLIYILCVKRRRFFSEFVSQTDLFPTSIFRETGYFKVGELKTFHAEWQMILKHLDQEVRDTKASTEIDKKSKKDLLRKKNRLICRFWQQVDIAEKIFKEIVQAEKEDEAKRAEAEKKKVEMEELRKESLEERQERYQKEYEKELQEDISTDKKQE